MRYVYLLFAIISCSISAVDTISVSNMSRLPLTVYYTCYDTPRCLVVPGRDQQTSGQRHQAIKLGYIHAIGRIQLKLGNNRLYELDAQRWPRNQLPRDEYLVLQVSGTDVPTTRWLLPPL